MSRRASMARCSSVPACSRATSLGRDELNPYDQFQHIQPTAVIEDGLFVFDGHFDIPLASALNHVTRAQLAVAGQSSGRGALGSAGRGRARSAIRAGRRRNSATSCGDCSGPTNPARPFKRRWTRPQTIHPEFQSGWMPGPEESRARRPLAVRQTSSVRHSH